MSAGQQWFWILLAIAIIAVLVITFASRCQGIW